MKELKCKRSERTRNGKKRKLRYATKSPYNEISYPLFFTLAMQKHAQDSDVVIT